MLQLQDRQTVPEALANDNWHGYVQDWIYKAGVTWMEETVSTPFWTGMTPFAMDRQTGGRRHLLRERLYQASSRVAFRGAGLQCTNGLEEHA